MTSVKLKKYIFNKSFLNFNGLKFEEPKRGPLEILRSPPSKLFFFVLSAVPYR